MTPPAPPDEDVVERIELDDLIARLGSTQPDWVEIARRLDARLDAEERELLPRLDRESARGIVQEMGYLRQRCAELGHTHRDPLEVRAFIAEVRAHAKRTKHFGFDLFHGLAVDAHSLRV